MEALMILRIALYSFLLYLLPTLVTSQATVSAGVNSSSLGASTSANFSSSATSASAGSFPLTYSNGADLNPKAGLRCQLGASGQSKPKDCHPGEITSI